MTKVDVHARHAVIGLIDRYRAGDITNDDFMNEYPVSPHDRAIMAIRTMLGNTQADLEVHRYADSKPTPWISELYDRCRVFCTTRHEYEWTQDNLVGLGGGPTLIELLTMGLLDRSQQRHDRFMRQLASEGDWSAWPFLKRADFERALGPARPCR